MAMEDWGLGELVYRTSVLLLYPTLVLLGLGFLHTIWYLGELAHDAWAAWRRRAHNTSRQLRDIYLDSQHSLVASLSAIVTNRWHPPQVRRFVALLLDELNRGEHQTLAARIDHLVSQVEASLARDVNRVRVYVRLGPCLGLAGTLIPLGPGLMALNDGDLGKLSSQLVVAFSTTVVGLLVGGVSYAIAVARAHMADLVASDIELVADLVNRLLDFHSDSTSVTSLSDAESVEVSA